MGFEKFYGVRVQRLCRVCRVFRLRVEAVSGLGLFSGFFVFYFDLDEVLNLLQGLRYW